MIKTVPIDKLKPDPNQPRKVFSDSHIAGLAKNLQVEGMINPIEVDSTYKILTGECRWRAAKKAKWQEVPVNINKKKFPPYERLRHQMAENLHQSAAGGASPMNAIDVAKGYRKMLEMSGYDFVPGTKWQGMDRGISKLGRELGISESTVREYLNLLAEPKYVLKDLAKGKARTFYRDVKDVPEKYREETKKAIAEGKLTSIRDLRRFAKLARVAPDKAMVEFLRITQQQSEDANRVLNRAIELSLALKNADPTKFSLEDKKMIRAQLGSTSQAIRSFFRKLKLGGKVIEGEIVKE